MKVILLLLIIFLTLGLKFKDVPKRDLKKVGNYMIDLNVDPKLRFKQPLLDFQPQIMNLLNVIDTNMPTLFRAIMYLT